jgi:hypothetical protein
MKTELHNDQGVYKLVRGLRPCVCPYSTRIPVPVQRSGLVAGNNQVELGINQSPCDSQCPMFNFKYNVSDIKYLTLDCSANAKFQLIDPIPAPGNSIYLFKC